MKEQTTDNSVQDWVTLLYSLFFFFFFIEFEKNSRIKYMDKGILCDLKILERKWFDGNNKVLRASPNYC